MTIDYDGQQIAPEPASAVIARFLRRSFSVADISKRAARSWLYGLTGLVLGFAFGVYSVWSTPPSYIVSVGLLPTDSGGGSDAMPGGESSSPLGALAGLIGVGAGPVPKFTRFIASVYASGVAKMMNDNYDMICRTYKNDCDLKTHTWHKHIGFDAWVDNAIAKISHTPDPDSPRTAADLAKYTTSNVLLASDKSTRVLKLTMETRDPKFASFYLVTLVNSSNDFIRDQDRSVIQPYITYLDGKLAANLNVAQREALSALLLEQERKLMLSSVKVPYAATIQDGPNITNSANLRRVLAIDCMLGLILGLGIGMTWKLHSDSKCTRSLS